MVDLIKQLDYNELSSDFIGIKTIDGLGYKFIAYPVEYGLKTKFMDDVNGLSVAMKKEEIIEITNQFNCTTNYYLHRTMYPINGTLKIHVGEE